MRMRRPIRWKTGSPSSSSSSRIWRLMADCETCSFSPAAVKEPLSAIARMISSCLRSMRSAYIPESHGFNGTDTAERYQSGWSLGLGAWSVLGPWSFVRRRLTTAGAFGWRGQRFAGSLDRLLQIAFIHLDANEAHVQLGARDGSRAELDVSFI